MNFYSPWSGSVCLLIIFALAASPALSSADALPSRTPSRVATIDGLRGFLALAVVLHHISFYKEFLIDREWTSPPSRIYSQLGPVGVSFFFMITGYLFWSRIIRQSGKAQWSALLIGRVFRIGPLYLTAVSAMLFLTFERAHFVLLDTPFHVTRSCLHWVIGLGLFGGADVNRYVGTDLWLAGVTWSIAWEWRFYLCLPILAFAARRKNLHLPLVAIATFMTLAASFRSSSGRPPLILISLFLVGMLCASLNQRVASIPIPRPLDSAAACSLLMLVFVFERPYSAGPVLLMGSVFYLIVNGCSVFGLLQSRSARRLGDLSYGIYLLQGLTLAAAFRPTRMKQFALSSPLHYWLCALLSLVGLIALATLAHNFIEIPGIELGKKTVRFFNDFQQKASDRSKPDDCSSGIA